MYFYFPQLLSKTIITKDWTEHLISCRVQAADQVTLCDLNGNWAKVRVTSLNKKSSEISFEVLESDFVPREVFFTKFFSHDKPKILIQSLIDKSYLEQLFEILPHSGFETVYLISSDFSPKQNYNLERLNKILLRSLEQSQSLWQPKIQLLKKVEAKQIIQDCRPTWLETSSNIKTGNSIANNNNQSQVILVGPEGGFSLIEKEYFNSLDLPKKSLGGLIYPSWLAGLVASKSVF